MIHPRHRRLALIVLVGLAVLLPILALRRPKAPTAAIPLGAGGPVDRRLDVLAGQFMEKEARAEADLQAHFPKEVASAPFRDALVEWWDAWNRNPDAWGDRLAGIERISWNPNNQAQFTGHESVAGFNWVAHALAKAWKRWKEEGWRVARTRWHLERWEASGDTIRAGVRFEVLAGRTEPTPARVVLAGLAWVDPAKWMGDPRGTVALEGLEVRRRDGKPAFEITAELEIPVPPHTPFCDPLIGLDGPDGVTLAMVGSGTLVRWRDGTLRTEPLPGLPPERIWAAAVSDWNHDGAPDLWLAGSDGLRVLPGPRWSGPGTILWRSPRRLPHPQALALADIDGDGDPDAFIGQYKLPYQGGQFPTPWHDALDGFPAVLLRNNGRDGWTDITPGSGLEAKAARRIYSASFADWNHDGRPDLVVASDFAGLDLFQNEGGGRFVDRTATLGTNRLGFGMGHWTGDIDGDGAMDVLLVGMDSPVADRLSWTGQQHPDWPEDAILRRGMTAGNRWLRWSGDRFAPMKGGETMARGGWAWAATVLDIDNDGWPDVHLANGHETLESARDYEEMFWTRDLHAAGSGNDRLADAWFRAAAGRRAAARGSYGGWQHGALFENQQGKGWRESGWLAGTALFADQRNAVAIDFNHDGRMDLAVTTMDLWPVRRQRLVLMANRSARTGHWLGIRFTDGPGTGTAFRLKAGGRVQERRITAGESHRSQVVGSVHWGLGEAGSVESLEVQAPGDATWKRLETPLEVDRWHDVRLLPPRW